MVSSTKISNVLAADCLPTWLYIRVALARALSLLAVDHWSSSSVAASGQSGNFSENHFCCLTTRPRLLCSLQFLDGRKIKQEPAREKGHVLLLSLALKLITCER